MDRGRDPVACQGMPSCRDDADDDPWAQTRVSMMTRSLQPASSC
jgi:hypothetical protein